MRRAVNGTTDRYEPKALLLIPAGRSRARPGDDPTKVIGCVGDQLTAFPHHHIQHKGLTMALHATPTSQSDRLAPLGIRYDLVHEALLKGKTD